MNLYLRKHMGYLPVSSRQKLMYNMVAIASRNNVTGNGLFREIASYLPVQDGPPLHEWPGERKRRNFANFGFQKNEAGEKRITIS